MVAALDRLYSAGDRLRPFSLCRSRTLNVQHFTSLPHCLHVRLLKKLVTGMNWTGQCLVQPQAVLEEGRKILRVLSGNHTHAGSTDLMLL